MIARRFPVYLALLLFAAGLAQAQNLAVQLKADGREVFRTFLTLPPYKALAVSTEGHLGFSFGRRSEKDAQKLAKEHCEENTSKSGPCVLVPVDASSTGKPSASN